MNRRAKGSLTACMVFFWVAVTGALYGPAALCVDLQRDLASLVESAKTKADHEAIAAAYEEEAKAVDADIARHRRMSIGYKGARQLRQHGARMKKHCDMLVKNYEHVAVELRGMARAEREVAAEL